MRIIYTIPPIYGKSRRKKEKAEKNTGIPLKIVFDSVLERGGGKNGSVDSGASIERGCKARGTTFPGRPAAVRRRAGKRARRPISAVDGVSARPGFPLCPCRKPSKNPFFPRFLSRNTKKHHVSRCVKNGDFEVKSGAPGGI